LTEIKNGTSGYIMQKKIHFLDQDTENFFKLVYGSIDSTRFVQVPLNEAEYLFFTPFTPEHHSAGPDTVKIFINGENLCPDFNACDYGTSSEYLDYDDRHLRMPNYAFYEAAKKLASRPKVSAEDLAKKTKFCNFIYSNSLLAHPIREQFFHDLNNVVPVVSAGRALRNDDSLAARSADTDWGAEKRNLVEQFRFTIAFENSEQQGYITEKLTDALLAHTIPIYWGDPRIAEDFNTDAFLHLRDYKTHAEAIAEIQRLDADPERMLAMMNAPIFDDGIDRAAQYVSEARDFLEAIFNQPLATARRRPRNGWVQWLEQKRRKDQKGIRRRLKRNRF
jgi:hypothetical protein